MVVQVVHSTVVTLPDEPGAEVNKNQWNDPHTITGLATVAGTGAYSDLTGTPALATVATSGLYSDLSGRPTSFVPPDGDKGDITVSSSGTVWAVDAQAITYAKIQNVSATDKLLGRSTVGAGVVEEIACTAAGRALIDDADATAQRATLALGAWAQVASGTGPITISGAGVSSITAQTGTGTTFAMQAGPSFTGSITLDSDAILVRDAANILAMRNGVNSQSLRIYSTYTDASNYARTTLDYSGASFRFNAEAAGTGTLGNILFSGNGTAHWEIIGSGGVMRPSTDNSKDLGATTRRVRVVYAGTLTGNNVAWNTGTTAADTFIERDAAAVLAQRNSTAAQTYRVYGTYTDASNYVRASLSASTTATTLAAESLGTGAANQDLVLNAKGTGTVQAGGAFRSTGLVMENMTASVDITIPAGYGSYVPDTYEIAAAATLEIAASACLEIG